jgi:hypothetical protein
MHKINHTVTTDLVAVTVVHDHVALPTNAEIGSQVLVVPSSGDSLL